MSQSEVVAWKEQDAVQPRSQFFVGAQIEGCTDEEIKMIRTLAQRDLKRSRRRSRLLRREVLDAERLNVSFAMQGNTVFCYVVVTTLTYDNNCELFGAARFNHNDQRSRLGTRLVHEEDGDKVEIFVRKRGHQFSSRIGRLIALRRALIDGGGVLPTPNE